MAEYNSDRTGANIDATLDKVDVRETVIDINNNTTRRISVNDSGVVFIGKSVSNIALEGVELFPDNRAAFTRDDGYPLLLNRTGSDGKLLDFRKNGSVVGSIGSNGGTPYMSGNIGGFRLTSSGGAGVMIPTDTSGNGSDADNDLGISTVRWRDLYLSGGVYLGGTGAANKLDDYEEGEFTPAMTSTGGTNPTYTVYDNRSTYTKVGELVVATIDINYNITAKGTGNLQVSLPFVSKGARYSYTCVSAQRTNTALNVVENRISGFMLANANKLQLHLNSDTAGGDTSPIPLSDLVTGAITRLCFIVTYKA